MPFSQKIIYWPGKKAPEGWLFCDGSLLTKENYPELYKSLGTTYGGDADGEKFALPNLETAAREICYSSKIRLIISDGKAKPVTPLGGDHFFRW